MQLSKIGLISFFFCVNTAIVFSQNVGIGTITPNPSAKLEVNSSSSGFLPPRMTSQQRNSISNPAQGLVLYCTDCGTNGELEVYNGIGWTNVMGGSALAPITTGQLLHYWNFNTPFSLTPNISLIVGGLLTFDYSTVTLTPGIVDSVGRTDILTANAQNGDTAGNALRVRCPVTSMIINAPTTNYKNISLSFAAAKSSSGPATDSVYYSLDGINYTTAGLSFPVFTAYTDPDYRVNSFDFSTIIAVNNNPNFKIKIVFVGGNTLVSGNGRFDNIAIKGTHL